MIKIITDTTSELPQTIREQFDIPVVPQLIHFGDQTYIEGKTISRGEFYEQLLSSEDLPKTAAPPPEMFSRIFSEHAGEGHQFLCIHPSSTLSGTVRSAQVSSQEFPEEKIHVVDSRLIASPLGTLVHQAALQAESGKNLSDILQMLDDLISRARIYFIVSTLDYLARGGRIGGASALIGNALQIKPILTLRNGQVEPCAKERTMNRAIKKVKTLVAAEYPKDRDGFLSIMHADAPDLAEEIACDLQRTKGLPAPLISPLTPAIVTHAGPGAVAVGFFS